MFQTKKMKIQTYLNKKSADQLTPFDELLSDYLSGTMKEIFSDLETKKIEIHIDWLPDYHCIGVQGIHNHNYLDLQIEPTEFSIGYDPIEPDNHIYFPLESKNQVYAILKNVFEISPDIEVKFEFNMSRKSPAKSGYRPHHLVKDDYLTSGVHKYYDVEQVSPGEPHMALLHSLLPKLILIAFTKER